VTDNRRIQEYEMGKGDRKTAKGKRSVASYGNARPHSAVTKPASVKKAAATPKAPVAKKAPAKKKAS
jgi:30S ribosomal protein S31